MGIAGQKKIDISKYKFSLASNRNSPSKNGFKLQTSEKTNLAPRLNLKNSTESTQSQPSRKETKASLEASFNKENLMTSTNSDAHSTIQAQSPVIIFSFI